MDKTFDFYCVRPLEATKAQLGIPAHNSGWIDDLPVTGYAGSYTLARGWDSPEEARDDLIAAGVVVLDHELVGFSNDSGDSRVVPWR